MKYAEKGQKTKWKQRKELQAQVSALFIQHQASSRLHSDDSASSSQAWPAKWRFRMETRPLDGAGVLRSSFKHLEFVK
jgi:hypothetical protein